MSSEQIIKIIVKWIIFFAVADIGTTLRNRVTKNLFFQCDKIDERNLKQSCREYFSEQLFRKIKNNPDFLGIFQRLRLGCL